MKLLDLFCGAGGAAMGYARAGFDVLGIDIKPQRNYPFAFVQADALDFLAGHWEGFDVIHASPPCQEYSALKPVTGISRYESGSLLPDALELLRFIGKPYVVENVPGSEHLMRDPVMLCGTSFGLPIQRHRYFESPAGITAPGCDHKGRVLNPHSQRGRERIYAEHGRGDPEKVWREATGLAWLGRYEAREAIPPAYTEWIGTQLRALIVEAG